MNSNFTNRLGQDNFTWWLGVVEDRKDPLNLGRCRVRMFGWHTDNKEMIPTESLPWAQPMVPVNGSLTTGTAQEGDYVFGFYFDGLSGQAPCIMGVLPGIPQEFVNNSKGFTDARSLNDLLNSPRKPVISGASITEGEAGLNPMIVGEPTTSRISRNEKVDETFIGYRKQTLDKNVQIAGGGTWSEPVTEYNAQAPFDRVLETESGHIMEFDDTPDFERIQLAHRKGTFFEIFPDGSKVTKVVGDNYEIILSNNNVHIKGACNITVDGNANIQAAFINLKGNTKLIGDLQVNGTITASGDVVGAGISLESHVHTGVKSGGDLSGPPN